MRDNAHQAMPRSGILARNLNLPPGVLSERIAPFRQDTVYCYIVDTAEQPDDRLCQTGSGPNFQGDLITLASCKHQMRTYLSAESWKGVWVAGFTRRELKNRLFYLMRVSAAYASHRELWYSDSISEETKTAKAAHLDRFGDIYQPKSESGAPYRPLDYHRPCKDHVHCEPGDWRKDIKYVTRYGRSPALLVGDPDYSFLWDKPMITSPWELGRWEKKSRLDELYHWTK